MSPKSTRILLTERALEDVRNIKSYSIKRWGSKTAERYIDRIDAALSRIAERPDILREEAGVSDALRLHRVEKHVLVCNVHAETVYVLTIVHTSMDIPRRLARLKPQLLLEADLLHNRVAARKKKRTR